MSANVTNGKPATDVNVLCGYNPTNAATAANLALNQANMRYFAEANCPAEIKKQLLNWMLSAFYEVIDRGDVGVSTMGSCDSISFYQAIIRLISPCHWPLRTAAINSTTHLLVQDCPSGAIERISAQSLGVPCRSELVAAPAAGSPKIYIDDTVNPANLVYWDCGQNVYRTVVITAASPELFTSNVTPPVAPTVGDHWQNTSLVTVSGVEAGQIAIWSGAAWVQSSNASAGLTGGTVVGGGSNGSNRPVATPFGDSILPGTIQSGGTLVATRVGPSNTDFHIKFTFTTPQPDTNYQIIGTVYESQDDGLGNEVASVHPILTSDIVTKTTTEFTFRAFNFSAFTASSTFVVVRS